MELTTYIAGLDCKSMVVENAVQQSILSVEIDIVTGVHEVTSYLLSSNVPEIASPGRISCTMIQDTKDPYRDFPADSTALRIDSVPSNPDIRHVVFNNPSSNLEKWESTSISISGTNPRVYQEAITRTSGPGIIPEDKSDVITPKSPFTKVLETNEIVPGELLYPVWQFKDKLRNVHTVEKKDSGKFWKTNNITGGRIKSLIGNYEDFDLRFIVTLEGLDVECRPSDFTRWSIGDWVYVVAIGEFIILPLIINGQGS